MVKYDEEKRSYFDSSGNKYNRVSDILKAVEPIFPRDAIARAIAKRNGMTVDEVQAEWEVKAKATRDIGNEIHGALDDSNKGTLDGSNYWYLMAEVVHEKYFKEYSVVASEKILSSADFRLAGCVDRICYRNKTIADIRDFKTNEIKGVQYRDEYNKYFRDPLPWLENTNYNRLALQLSLYGLLMEDTTKYKVGNLAGIFIPPHDPMNHSYIPVPYMKLEAQLLIRHYMSENHVEPLRTEEVTPFS